jgi:hypothetical protein
MDADFLGLHFDPIDLGDRARIAELLSRDPQPLSGYAFASLIVWEPVYHYRYAVVGGRTLLMMSSLDGRHPPSLLQPIGEFSNGLEEALLRCGRELGEPLRIESVSEEFLARHPGFAARFDVVPVRGAADYLYAAADLAALRGRRYAKKRNLIAQAAARGSWSVEELGPAQVEECHLVADDIATKRSAGACATLEQENTALERAFQLFGPLGLQGLLLRVDGRPGAFSIFDRLNPTTAVVLFERALRSEKGLYQLINRETARAIAARGYTLINREEDLDDPGLRHAKLSYCPSRLEMKYSLTLRPGSGNGPSC